MRRILNLSRHVLSSNFFELRHPYKITYIVTYRCQLRCRMCNIWQRASEYELSYEEINEFFERSNRFSWINLSGGEIFLREDLIRIIESISKNCRNAYLLNFPTNGYQPDVIVHSIKKIIAHCRFPKLLTTVSLDGPPRVHDQIRGTPGSWEKAVETFSRLRLLRARSFGVFLGMTLQDVNYALFDETVNSVRERIPDITHSEFHVNMAHRSGHYYDNLHFQISKGGQQLREELYRIMKLRKRSFVSPVSFLEQRYQKLAGGFLQSGSTPVPCQALSASLFMDPAGTVHPCSVFDNPIGNIKDFGYDLNALWKTEKRSALRSEILKANCPQCWTPCEAYQSILGDLAPSLIGTRGKND